MSIRDALADLFSTPEERAAVLADRDARMARNAKRLLDHAASIRPVGVNKFFIGDGFAYSVTTYPGQTEQQFRQAHAEARARWEEEQRERSIVRDLADGKAACPACRREILVLLRDRLIDAACFWCPCCEFETRINRIEAEIAGSHGYFPHRPHEVGMLRLLRRAGDRRYDELTRRFDDVVIVDSEAA